ncbi:MAG: DUF1643 domain-containing protein [Tepidibacter sp.]|jgi:hypothetical protein|uniref:DUF1643 domain-containing protein n=1 Tax=Tepidibacter sp. TaxID=2529387 RepID=UPI0025EF9EA9|nr:DUF1643 domain-containing protein [Tepidibacter sp.]MCT4510003.1 DUF1643 domain-containing protein [Tepidibacter sp.]
MTSIEKSTIRTEACFSKDRLHRYILRKEWDKNKKKAMIVMINPSYADELLMDYTTMYVINNLLKLGFGVVEIANIFSRIDIKINVKDSIEEFNDKENDRHILKAAAKADYIIIAWGKAGEKNKKIQERQKKVLELLKEYNDRLYIIQDKLGRGGYHPLAPHIRFNWKLKKIDIKD